MRPSHVFGWPLIAAAAVLISCDTAPPGSSRPPQATQPNTKPSESQPLDTPATGPSTQPTTQPTTSATTEEPESPPEFLTVIERINESAPAVARARIESGNRLVIETRNVRRLRIDRNELPLDNRKRIVLRLDTIGIEWLAKSPIEEFQREPSGLWIPVEDTDR